MMFKAESLIRAHVPALEPYQPIHPFEVLSEQLGLPVEEIIKLDANENPYGPHPTVLHTLGTIRFSHIYPDPESTHLRRALADRYQVPFENILAGAGADELIDLIMRLFLDPGDAILFCPPTFGMYSFDASVNDARVISIPRRADFSLDLEAIETAVMQESPKLMFLTSPNNPDGSLVPPAELERLLELPVVVVLDEAYVEFSPPGASRIQDVATRGNLIVLRTFSKWAGLAGLRVGFGLFPTSLMGHLWKIKQPYNVSVVASGAAMASLSAADDLDRVGEQIISERGRLYAELEQVSYLEPYPTQANFILCRVTRGSAADLKAGLAREGILIRYFNKPGLQDHIRISVGKPEHTDALIEALRRME